MAKGYSIDLRERVLGAIKAGALRRSAAPVFSVSPSSAIKRTRRWRSTGQVAASSVRGHRRSALIDYADWLLALVADQLGLTLNEILERGVETSVTSP